MAKRSIAVYGASGHTGRFVTAELARRAELPILIGRDEKKLALSRPPGSSAAIRVADVADSPSLDAALEGAEAVINCAGPFLETAGALVEAALRRGISYLDVTAEQMSASTTLERYDTAARGAGVAVVPAASFYGALGDLLATAAIGDWPDVDEIRIAIALNRWWPTEGTRRTGERNTYQRLVIRRGALVPLVPSPSIPWRFPEPFGTQDVVEVPLSETILIARHLRVSELRNYINEAPLRDLNDPATPSPVPVDPTGRSGQQFVMEAIARKGTSERRAAACGRDIYAVTAPIVVEAAQRVLAGGLGRGGAFAAGEIADARDFLRALSPEHLNLDL